jgi:hypothetical protein
LVSQKHSRGSGIPAIELLIGCKETLQTLKTLF